MKSFLELFEPRPPDESSLEPLIEFSGMEEGIELQLRMFNLIADLSFVKTWLRDPEKRTNWKDPAMRVPVFRYDNILNGRFAQSFMVLLNGKQQVQLDLSLLKPSMSILLMPNRKENATISYLYTAQHRMPRNFISALEILVTYFFSLSSSGHLFIAIPTRDRDTNADVVNLGFLEQVRSGNATGEVRVYELSRDQFENRLMDMRWNT